MKIEKVNGTVVRANLFTSMPLSVEEYSMVQSEGVIQSYCNETRSYVNVKQYKHQTSETDSELRYCHMDVQYSRALTHFKELSGGGGLECHDSGNEYKFEVLFEMEV